MSDLIVVTYPDRFRAEEVLLSVRRMKVAHLIELEDACTVTKDATGNVKLKHSVNLACGGAMSGGFWGMLIGILFFNPILGGIAGASLGALAGVVTEYGITDDFLKSLAKQMQPDSSSIFMLITQVTPDRVLEELSHFGGEILQTSLSRKVEGEWQAALSGNNMQMPADAREMAT